MVVLNRGDNTLSLLANDGSGGFASPVVLATLPPNAQPSQIASVVLPGDSLPSLAVLIPNLDEIWIYPNDQGKFDLPLLKVDAGANPTGFSVPTGAGTPDLLVGTASGDVLKLVYDPMKIPSRQTAATCKALAWPCAIPAGNPSPWWPTRKQERSGSTTYRGTVNSANRFKSAPARRSSFPGAVQTFTVNGDPNPYLAVANSLGNDILVYHHDPTSGQFVPYDNPNLPASATVRNSYPVGDYPISITVSHLRGGAAPTCW